MSEPHYSEISIEVPVGLGMAFCQTQAASAAVLWYKSNLGNSFYGWSHTHHPGRFCFARLQ